LVSFWSLVLKAIESMREKQTGFYRFGSTLAPE